MGWGGYSLYRVEKQRRLVNNARTALRESAGEQALFWASQALKNKKDGVEECRLMAEVAAALFPRGSRLAEVERAVFLGRTTPDHAIVVTARLEDRSHAAAEVHTRGACAARATLRFAP